MGPDAADPGGGPEPPGDNVDASALGDAASLVLPGDNAMGDSARLATPRHEVDTSAHLGVSTATDLGFASPRPVKPFPCRPLCLIRGDLI